MTKMIKEYENSCKLVKIRIKQLTDHRKQLRKEGSGDVIEKLDLDRRIRLLYTEHEQMSEIIQHLCQYNRRIEQSARKGKLQ